MIYLLVFTVVFTALVTILGIITYISLYLCEISINKYRRLRERRNEEKYIVLTDEGY